VSTVAVVRAYAAARADDRVLGVAFLVTGAFLLYLVLFADGVLLAVVLGAGSGPAPLHELLHDGRHLRGAPCH
jgi:hypothetical protein